MNLKNPESKNSMTRKRKDKPPRQALPKFFPFSAGIPWTLKRGKYINPYMDSQTWHDVLDGKNIIVTAFGGILESFFSLSVAEGIKSFDPDHELFWLGNQEFHPFVRAQGLCKVSNIDLTQERLQDYPVPVFFDLDNNAYFNVLNNYLIQKAYWGLYPEPVTTPALEQIFSNAMIPWQGYFPQLRQLGSEMYDDLCKQGRIKPKSRIITIVLDDESKSDVLDWSVQNIKEFYQLALTKGFKVVVFTNNVNSFYGTKIIPQVYNLRNILQVLKNSWLVMSNDVEWLLVSMMVSDAKIISKNVDGPFDLFKNSEFIQVQNDIFTDIEWVSPVDAFTICKGIL